MYLLPSVILDQAGQNCCILENRRLLALQIFCQFLTIDHFSRPLQVPKILEIYEVFSICLQTYNEIESLENSLILPTILPLFLRVPSK